MTIRMLIFALILLVGVSARAAEPVAPRWEPWSKASFSEAKSEKKVVFLYLEAVWCHWCHVMQQETLADPAVRKALAQHFISVRVDHDANPLLANRYRDWGWPALIFLAPDGTEIVKRAGYLSPENFTSLLDAIVKDPTPEHERASERALQANAPSALSETLRANLQRAHLAHYDKVLGGLDLPQRFLDRNSVEYSLELAAAGNAEQQRRVQQTLDAGRSLIDPVWGGAYQYSTGGDWQHPHYEKIMRTQSGVLRLYALACAQWNRAGDCAAAADIVRFLNGFLLDPSGAYYVSQDADLRPGQKAAEYFALGNAARRKLGVPRIDRHLYADANGQAIEALATYAGASGNADALNSAVRAAEWVLKNRTMKGGGFRHDAGTSTGPYLSDSLAMARGLLALYRVTGDQRWLARAAATGSYIDMTFKGASGGFLTARGDGSPVTPLPDLEENISLARLMNLLRYYTGNSRFGVAAKHAMKYLASDAVATKPYEEAGILLADDELRREPLHLTVVGGKFDPAAQALFARANRSAGFYARVEWWDPAGNLLPNADVKYPTFPKAAGFVCTGLRCSSPAFEETEYGQRIKRLTASN